MRVKLRGAISGFGEVAARAHLPGWRTRDDLSIVAVHEPVSARRHEALRLIKNVRVYDDLELMLDGEALDFVDIASPPALHAAAARAALQAGAHVIVEKPLSLGLAEFDELARIARDNARVLMCVHNWKFAPPYAAAHDAIIAGRLGALRYAALDRFRVEPAGAGSAGAKWRASAQTGGGILIDHGWHVFYLMRWLMGDASPLAVSARLAPARVTRRSPPKISPTCAWCSPTDASRARICRGERRCEGPAPSSTARRGCSRSTTIA